MLRLYAVVLSAGIWGMRHPVLPDCDTLRLVAGQIGACVFGRHALTTGGGSDQRHNTHS